MSTTIIVGDGPGSLSAALFLAKNGHQVTVIGDDKTAVHFAHLKNYLGIDDIGGSEFHQIAREQARRRWCRTHRWTSHRTHPRREGISGDDRRWPRAQRRLCDPQRGPQARVGDRPGIGNRRSGAIAVDADQRSSVDGVYVIGRSVRPSRSQVIISAGAGAVAAVDILSREAGQDVQDWDAPPKEDGGS